MTTKKKKFNVMEPISTAPKDKTIIVWNPHTLVDEKVSFDSSWGGGRGAWFTEQGKLIGAKFWNPMQTNLRKDCDDIADHVPM